MSRVKASVARAVGWIGERWAVRSGLSASRSEVFARWLESEIAFHRNDRRAMLGVSGMEGAAYDAKLRASTCERAQFALGEIMGRTVRSGALPALSAVQSLRFVRWLELAAAEQRLRSAEFANDELWDVADYNRLEARSFDEIRAAFVAIARGALSGD